MCADHEDNHREYNIWNLMRLQDSYKDEYHQELDNDDAVELELKTPRTHVRQGVTSDQRVGTAHYECAQQRGYPGQ
jgi:hypothetical protein